MKNAWIKPENNELLRLTVREWREKSKGSIDFYDSSSMAQGLILYQFEDLVAGPELIAELQYKLNFIELNTPKRENELGEILYLYAYWDETRIWSDALYPFKECVTNTGKKFRLI